MCWRDAQAAELTRAEPALAVMQRTGLYRLEGEEEAAREWQRARADYQAALQAYR